MSKSQKSAIIPNNSQNQKVKTFFLQMKEMFCFELLQAAQLNATESQLVLTGVDYKKGKAKENLLDQMKTSLKKFKGRLLLLWIWLLALGVCDPHFKQKLWCIIHASRYMNVDIVI